jgi:hypothetical protein
VFVVHQCTKKNDEVITRFSLCNCKNSILYITNIYPITTRKPSFVPVHNPHLYRVLNSYKPSGTNEGGTFVPAEIPGTDVIICTGSCYTPVQMCFPTPLPGPSFPSILFFPFLFFFSSHLIHSMNTRFTTSPKSQQSQYISQSQCISQ